MENLRNNEVTKKIRATYCFIARKPDWWVGEEEYNSRDDLIDVCIGPLELEIEGRSYWIDFSVATLIIETMGRHIHLYARLAEPNRYKMFEMNGFDISDDLIEKIYQDEAVKVKTVNFAEVLHLDMELAQFDALELAECYIGIDDEKPANKDITGAELRC